MTRIVACGQWDAERARALEQLRAAGYEVEFTRESAGPLDCVVERPPDILLFGVDSARPWEAGALKLVRRVHPLLPLVIVTADGSVEERLRLEAVKPAYVAVDPIESAELIEAIHDLASRGARRGGSALRWRRPTRYGPAGGRAAS
jgi:DNA-binding NarL/FixJ family response regulator